MITYRKFMAEMFSEDPFAGCETLVLTEAIKYSRDYPDMKHHEADVNGHQVEVQYSFLTPRSLVDGAKHYAGAWDVNFEVNHNFDSAQNTKPMSSDDHQKILHHVANSVHNFVRTVRPKKLYMMGNNPTKNKLYAKFAEHLARTHGGQVEQGQYSEFWGARPQIVNFPNH